MGRLLSCGIVAVCCLLARADLPPAFSDVTLDAAKKQVEGSEKVVVIKFTADWCPPCKAMDKTTWRDDGVVKWVKDHGVALQVDVDADQKTALAYNIEAMPTMVMLRGGMEIARTVGYLKPDQMMAWLEEAATGKPAAAAGGQNFSELQRLFALFDQAVQDRKYTDAVSTMRAIWSKENAKDPLRVLGAASLLRNTRSLETLIANSAEGRSAVTELRDALEESLAGAKSDGFADLRDWLTFNEVLGDDARSLAWFDRIKGTEGADETFSQTFVLVQPLLARSKRWADLPVAYPNGAGWAERQFEIVSKQAKAIGASDPKTAEAQFAVFEIQVAQIYAGYVATGNIRDANAIAETLLQLRDTPGSRVALVEQSLNAGVVGPGAKLWLDEAGSAGQDVAALRVRLADLQKK